MSWREEQDIVRALNASIRHSSSRHDSCSSIVNTDNGSTCGQQSADGQFTLISHSTVCVWRKLARVDMQWKDNVT